MALTTFLFTNGESSDKTVQREVEEELGKKVILKKYLTTIENFFDMNDYKYHEILFVYLADFADSADQKINYTLENREGKNFLKYEWIDINSIDHVNIYPSCIKDLFHTDTILPHMINNM